MRTFLFSILFIVWLMLLAIFFSACEEDDGYIPPFTCQVNGEEWRPDSRLGQLAMFTYLTDDFLSISGSNDNSGVGLAINDSTGIEANKLYAFTNEPVYYGTYYKRENGARCDYDYPNIISGKMLITRLDDEVISGTFEFTSYNPDCGDTIKVTEGRFDINEITK